MLDRGCARCCRDARPAYSGTCFLELQLGASDPQAKTAAAIIGSVTLTAVAPGQGILAHCNADGSIHTYVAVNRPQAWLADEPDGVIAKVVALFDDWAPSLRWLIAGSDDLPLVRPIYALPAGMRWPRVPGATLIGGAAHVMSPFAGEGANLAMLDGVELERAGRPSRQSGRRTGCLRRRPLAAQRGCGGGRRSQPDAVLRTSCARQRS